MAAPTLYRRAGTFNLVMFVENKIPNMERYQTWEDTKHGRRLHSIYFQRPPLIKPED